MYSKAKFRGSKHESITETHSVGTPSYIYVRVYAPFAGALFTSLACPTLACDTYLQIPRTHIIFSLSSYTIGRQDLVGADAHPITMITLGTDAATLHQHLSANASLVDVSVRELQRLSRETTRNTALELQTQTDVKVQDSGLVGGGDSSSEGSDSDASTGGEAEA